MGDCELSRAIMQRRDNLNPEELDAMSSAAISNLERVAEFSACRTVMFYAHFRSHIHEHRALSRVWLAGVYAYAAPIASGLLYGQLQTHLGGLLISLALLSMVIMALRLRLAPCRMGTREAALCGKYDE